MPRSSLLLIVLVALPSFAGCASDSRQWAGLAEAWMYRDSALVEVQLHRGNPGSGATAETARAGMSQVVAIEDATAELTARDGRNVTRSLDNWTFDRENDTAQAPLDVTRFDAFRLNATFVLGDGTRLNTGELASWGEQYRRPYQATLRLGSRATDTSLILSIYELKAGARELAFDSVVQKGTLTPVAIARVDSWRVNLTGANGTVEDTTPPTAGQTIRVTLPHTGITRAQPRYSIVLADGSAITERDVDNDVYPETLALQKRLKQEN